LIDKNRARSIELADQAVKPSIGKGRKHGDAL
jgi:hypothetical protein